MEETIQQEKYGFMSRVAGLFSRTEPDEDYETFEEAQSLQMKTAYRYTVTVRKDITTFDDAIAAAHGLKRGEQQILNLSGTDIAVRQKIVDFMAGVNFAQEGTWESVGENIYLIVPASAYVEVAPASPSRVAFRN